MIAAAAPYVSVGTLLRIEDVSLAFGETVILRNCNGTIEDIVGHGQVVALLGPSGIGKTQLSRIIAGLQAPSSGHVLVTERALPVARGMVGYVFQNYLLIRERTVFGNLALAARQGYRESRVARTDRVWAMLERFALQGQARLYPAQLSGGQRQRVAIAQQLLCSDHYLIMDEPLSGLDPVMVDCVCALIAEVAAAHELNTLIVVTHDVRSAIKVADTLWMLGRDRDAGGAIIPGARVVDRYDLVAEGLAWQPDVSRLPRFLEVERTVRDKFKEL